MSLPMYVELPPFYINQSRWKAYVDCDRYYAWQHIEGLEPTRQKVYFEIGTAVHNAQVQAQNLGATKEAFEIATKDAEVSFRKGMAGPRLPGDEEVIQGGVDIIRRMLPAYHQHWGAQGHT